jgi:hypothetical protein
MRGEASRGVKRKIRRTIERALQVGPCFESAVEVKAHVVGRVGGAAHVNPAVVVVVVRVVIHEEICRRKKGTEKRDDEERKEGKTTKGKSASIP